MPLFTQIQKAPEPLLRIGCFFCLSRLPPQSPANKNVLNRYSFQRRKTAQSGCKPSLSPSADKGKRKGKQKSASEIQNILNIKSGENKKKPLDSEESRVNLMAEDEGFEPPQTESESGVLPLHKSSIAGTFVIIRTFLEMSRSFSKIFIFSDRTSISAAKAVYSSQGKGFPAKTWSFK